MEKKLTVTVSEMAALLGVSRPTAYQILKREDFHAAFKVGARTLISLVALEEWIASQTTGGAA